MIVRAKAIATKGWAAKIAGNRQARRVRYGQQTNRWRMVPILQDHAGVAALTAMTAVRGAAYNVMVNLQSLPNDDFSNNLKEKTDKILENVDSQAKKIKQLVEDRLWG